MSKQSTIVSWLAVFIILALVLYPTAFDKRPNLFEYTKWAADSSGLLLGYAALLFGFSLLKASGGKMKKGLAWFSLGMFIMGSSFFFGPIINHYKIIDKDLVEAIHGVGMLGGMLGWLMAHYWFLSVVETDTMTPKQWLAYGLVFLVFIALFFPTMFAARTFGNALKYWTELAGFGIGAVMLVMAIKAYRYIGSGYKTAINWLMLSSAAMVLAYPFGPIGQPNHFWTGATGGTFHHGIMAFSILLFLGTVFYFQRMEIFTNKTS